MKNILYILLSTLFALSTNAQTEGVPSVLPLSELDAQPEYPGGFQAFYKFVTSKFVMPEIQQDINAKIYVSFVIETDGSLSNIKLLRDPGFGLGAEAIRVLKLVSEKWKPGIVGAKKVRSSYFMPITINIVSPPVVKN